jgi:16S rRNA (cytidine1402-2'-O)-methyltransferase
MDPGLYVVGTPIGNLGDLTMRALETLRAVELVLAEDTRHTRKLLSRYEISVPMESCHQHNEKGRSDSIVGRVQQGGVVALVTDSGMPGVSDPGAQVVDACLEAGLPVTVVPGPCAVSSAVALCGFPMAAFVFEGFLPVKSGGRGKRLDALIEEDRGVVLYESPHRLIKLLGQLHDRMPERPVFVGRELTKKLEECRRGLPADILAAYEGRTVKGELVLVLAPQRKRKRSARRREFRRCDD